MQPTLYKRQIIEYLYKRIMNTLADFNSVTYYDSLHCTLLQCNNKYAKKIIIKITDSDREKIFFLFKKNEHQKFVDVIILCLRESDQEYKQAYNNQMYMYSF